MAVYFRDVPLDDVTVSISFIAHCFRPAAAANDKEEPIIIIIICAECFEGPHFPYPINGSRFYFRIVSIPLCGDVELPAADVRAPDDVAREHNEKLLTTWSDVEMQSSIKALNDLFLLTEQHLPARAQN